MGIQENFTMRVNPSKDSKLLLLSKLLYSTGKRNMH